MKKTKKNTVKPFKYGLYDALYKKYGVDHLNGKVHIANEVLRMSLATINNDFGIQAGDKKNIPFPRLVLYAEHFGTTPDALLNKFSKPRKISAE